MLYAQDSKRLIECMTPKARMRLVFKALYKKFSGGLRALKHGKLKATIQSYEYEQKKICYKEEFMRSGVPRQLVDALLRELEI